MAMRKLLAIILSAILLASVMVTYVAADNGDTSIPDLVITELVPDTSCYVDETGKDAFEYVEIINTSGRELNLYDYELLYNGNINTRTKPGRKTEINPGAVSTSLVDTSRTPHNPSTAIVAPGEIVLLWMWNFDSYKISATVENFRQAWGIDQSVAVYVLDADNSSGTGNSDRFNLANTNQKGFYLAPKGYDLTSETIDGVTSYVYWRQSELAAGKTTADYGANYVYGAADTNKQMKFAGDAPATPGTLNDAQKASLEGVNGITFVESPTEEELLAQAKALALTELEASYNAADTSATSQTVKDLIKAAYDTAYANVNNASSIEAANDAKTAGINAITTAANTPTGDTSIAVFAVMSVLLGAVVLKKKKFALK